MKFFFLDNNDQHRQLHRIYLENIFDGCTVHEFNSIRAMERAFAAGRLPDVVICGAQMRDGDAGMAYELCRKVTKSIPFLLFSQNDPESFKELAGFKSHHSKNTHIAWPCSPAEFREQVSRALFPERFGSEPVAAFQKVRLINFYRFNQVLCQVFIKLSDRKYVRVFNANIKYTKKELDHLREKGVTHLFIRNDDFHIFQNAFKRRPFLTSDGSALEDPHEAMALTHTLMQELVKELGISEAVVKMVEGSIKHVTQVASKSDSLRELFANYHQKDDYFYDHSFLSAAVSCEILSRLGENTEDARNDIVMASLFHDGLVHNENIARVSSMQDQRLNHFTKDEVLDYLRHPSEMADMIKEEKGVSSRATTLIRQHHERPDGQGFPLGLKDTQIDPLSRVFILAHEFVDMMDGHDYDPGMVGVVLEKLRKVYGSGPFQSTMTAFLEVYDRVA